MKLVTIRVTQAEADQLLSYVAHRDICGEAPGWYYGNKEHFERRHASLVEVITRAISTNADRENERA